MLLCKLSPSANSVSISQIKHWSVDQFSYLWTLKNVKVTIVLYLFSVNSLESLTRLHHWKHPSFRISGVLTMFFFIGRNPFLFCQARRNLARTYILPENLNCLCHTAAIAAIFLGARLFLSRQVPSVSVTTS